MAVEINDQKLIDIIYVDDKGNKVKYSGPFINDLTITPEIEEQISNLNNISNKINELKSRLDTLNNTVNSFNTITYTYTDTVPSGSISTVYILPTNTSHEMYSSFCFMYNDTNWMLGFLNWNLISSKIYLGLTDNSFKTVVNNYKEEVESGDFLFSITGPNETSFSHDILKKINPNIVTVSNGSTEAYIVAGNVLDYGIDYSSYIDINTSKNGLIIPGIGLSTVGIPLKDLLNSNSNRYLFDILFIHNNGVTLPDTIITETNYAIMHCDLGFKPEE